MGPGRSELEGRPTQRYRADQQCGQRQLYSTEIPRSCVEWASEFSAHRTEIGAFIHWLHPSLVKVFPMGC